MKSANLPPAETQAPPPDDFAGNIDGIGPTIETRLHESGIRTFAQLAAMTSTALFELLQGFRGMSVERLAELDWPGAAQKLAAEEVASAEAARTTSTSGNRQHYANFHVELLLDEENNVRRTRVQHIETKKEAQPWTGWDGRRLLDFIQDAALHTASGEATAKPELLTNPKLEVTKAQVATVDGIVESGIVALDQAWSMQLEWVLSDATADMLTGNWLVRALLESIGPGDEYALPRVGPVKVPLRNYAESNNGDHRYRYAHQLVVAEGSVAQGTYELAVSVFWEKEDGTLGKLASFFNETIQVYTRI
jgi:hypothetical protein